MPSSATGDPLLRRVLFDYFFWGLNEFDERPRACDGEFDAALGVNEANVVTRGPRADPTWREAYTFGAQPVDRCPQVVDPQPDVVERRLVDGGLACWIDGLHQVNLDASAFRSDVKYQFVDVFGVASVVARHTQPQSIHPQRCQRFALGGAEGDLLDTEHSERTRLVRRVRVE